MKHFSDIELEIMLEGAKKAITELQAETLKEYPQSAKTAIQNELQAQYKRFDDIRQEQEKRLEAAGGRL